jgi:hypothetical protein
MSIQVTFTSRNGSITTGGTSQQLAPANTSRQYLLIQNPTTAAGQGIAGQESLFIRFTSAAGVNNGTSFEILPGASFELDTVVSTEAVEVNAQTSGHVWIAVEA